MFAFLLTSVLNEVLTPKQILTQFWAGEELDKCGQAIVSRLRRIYASGARRTRIPSGVGSRKSANR
jgi:hypothetical protein